MKIYELLLDYACNAKCGFCYNPPLTPEVLAQKIGFRRGAELLVRARADGYQGVWFTGGEPTLRSDLPKFLMLSRKLGFARIQIGTNAVRLGGAAYARTLAAAGLNYARVSLHSAGRERHDELMRLPGAFDAALKGIAHLRRRGVQVGLNFVLTARNFKELPAFARFCARELGLLDINVIFPHYRGMMAPNGAELGVRYREAAPYVREALAALGCPPAPMLINVPPCVFPGMEPWIADWAHGGSTDRLVLPRNSEMDIHEMKGAQRVKGPGCARCSLEPRCQGVEVEYAGRHGFDEFPPIRAGAGAS